MSHGFTTGRSRQAGGREGEDVAVLGGVDEDVAAKLAALEEAGGKRLAEPMSAPGMGTFGYLTDPSGTALGLIGP